MTSDVPEAMTSDAPEATTLVLSLCTSFIDEVLPVGNASTVVNYGLNRRGERALSALAVESSPVGVTGRVRNAEQLSRRVRRTVEESRDFILDALAPVPSPNGRTDTRRQVLEAAIGLFGRNGFEACTMRDLASAAGVKPPALYNHFGSKEQILAEVMRDTLGRFFRSVLEPLADEPSTSWLAAIVQRHTRFQIDELELALAHDMLRLSEHRQTHLPEADADTIRQVESAYYNIVRELLRARTGWRSHERLTVSTFAVLAICDRTNAWYRPGGSLRSEQVAALNWELVERMTAAE